MTPPLLIRFTSPTTYDVLDNTDPGNPIPLFPPLMNQTFTPGISNSILPEDEGKTAFTSFGGVLPVSPTYQQNGTSVDSVNGFFPERIDIGFTNPNNGLTANQRTLITPLNATAREIAESLSKRDGVEASARTTVEITDLETDSINFLDTEFTLNGVVLTQTLGPNQNQYDANYPDEVPDPITLNFLADRINANYELQDAGIVARSDGGKLTIIDLNGDDLDFELRGDAGDSFRIGNGIDIPLTATAMETEDPLSKYEGYDFSEGGPYIYEFSDPSQGTISFEMTGTFATGDDLLDGFRQAIENSGYVFSGNVDVDISEKGQVTFQPRLEVSGAGTVGSNKVSIGGQVKVIVDEHYDLNIAPPGNNLFPTDPVGEPVAFGFHVNIDGIAEVGDEFTVDFNSDGTSDSRNGVEMAALQSTKTVKGQSSYSDSYARLVEVVGSVTSRAQINRDSSEVLLRNSQTAVDATSGVNLDEEAAALIKYELAYNASAQVIQVARDIFDTLISTFR